MNDKELLAHEAIVARWISFGWFNLSRGVLLEAAFTKFWWHGGKWAFVDTPEWHEAYRRAYVDHACFKLAEQELRA